MRWSVGSGRDVRPFVFLARRPNRDRTLIRFSDSIGDDVQPVAPFRRCI